MIFKKIECAFKKKAEMFKHHKVYNQTQFFSQNYCGQTTVLRQSDLFSKKGKFNFNGGIFSPFWDNIQNEALIDEKHAQLPRTADRAPES